MYKKEGLVDSIKGVLSSEEKKLDTIDIEFYNNLYEINKVFEEKKYKCKIGSKISPDSTNQSIIYINPINESEKYEININNKYSITLTIPIKNSNFLYTTNFFDLKEILSFIKIHI